MQKQTNKHKLTKKQKTKQLRFRRQQQKGIFSPSNKGQAPPKRIHKLYICPSGAVDLCKTSFLEISH